MKYLFVVAHPDDEALGAGATMHTLAFQGHEIEVATMANHAAARKNLSDTLAQDQKQAFKILCVSKTYAADFPNIKMNTVAHLDMVQFIETCIMESQPDIVVTHHPADTNIDHVMTSEACQAAIRIFQRRDDVKPLQELWFMEVLSSTEWNLNVSKESFAPNMWIEVGKSGLQAKLKALGAYTGVMRDYPHPRSTEVVEGLAAYRGSQANVQFAESFQCVFRRVSA